MTDKPIKGGVATWACLPGFPPAVIFPFTPGERFGIRNLYEFQMLMYRPLYWLGRDGEPAIDYDLSVGEEPVWDETGRTCTVRIKPWKWSNGETVCADNVVFWMNMLKTKGPKFGAYSEGYFPDNLVSFEKVADDKVSFTFDKAYSKNWVLLNQLTMITPMPKAWDRTADGPADATHDIGQAEAVYEFLMAENGDPVAEDNAHRTRWADSPVWSVVNGPWRLKSYTKEGVITFVPNEHYSGPNPARLDELRQVSTTSDEQQYELLQSGDVQVGFLPPGMGVQPDGDPTKGGPNPLGEGFQLEPQILFNINFMAVNFGNPTVAGHLLRQPYVRQALQSCFDQEYGAREVYQGYGWSQTGSIPVLPKSELVSPKITERGGFWPFDLEKARQLLADNGWDVSASPAVCVRPGTGPGEAGEGIPAGTELSFSLRYWEGRPSLARLMAQFRDDAAKAGIEIRLEEVMGSVLVAQDGPGEARMWELSCWGGGWVYNYPTGENLFQSGAACNFSNYRDARADELIAKTVTTDDLEALYEYQEYIADQAPVIFMPTFPRRLFEVAGNLRGFTPLNPYGLINPENWYYVREDGS
ncbi:ABC transporter substrate-binding protein [Amycolatopsis orientalis]|uniref:ABC transporter substrate-binding protein n=1 Tax=Amycolatopsis orientalis TaxID=31958 RepID=UPI0004108013|nr:ABC transporter substrate-binding protein [Amycolatopsis orientalis]